MKKVILTIACFVSLTTTFAQVSGATGVANINPSIENLLPTSIEVATVNGLSFMNTGTSSWELISSPANAQAKPTLAELNVDDVLPKEIMITAISGTPYINNRGKEWLQIPTPKDVAIKLPTATYNLNHFLIDEVKVATIGGNAFLNSINEEWEIMPTPENDRQTKMVDFIGSYKMAGLPFDYLNVQLVNGTLVVLVNDLSGNLNSIKNSDTFDANGVATFKFVRNQDQKVTGISLAVNNLEFNGQKTS